MSKYRYPGAKPFSTEEQPLYYGREQQVHELLELIAHQNFLVLYGHSGTGKSSLINAGLIPLIEQEEQYQLAALQFNNYQPGHSPSPLQSLIHKVKTSKYEAKILELLEEENFSLWCAVKEIQFRSKNQGQILLIFDQMEKLFTFPEEEIREFYEQIQHIIQPEIPEKIQQKAQTLKLENHQAETALLEHPYPVKILFVIRADKLSELISLNKIIPNILSNCYELNELSYIQGQEALTKPALPEDSKLASPSFRYTKECLKYILDFLSDNEKHRINPFELQMIAQFVERELVIERERLMIKQTFFRDLNKVLENFYENFIRSISPKQERKSVIRLVEHRMISADRKRLAVSEGEILKDNYLNREILEYLTEHRLLTAEKHLAGDTYYLLSHESLIEPILRMKHQRRTYKDKRKQRWIAISLIVVFGSLVVMFGKNIDLKSRINFNQEQQEESQRQIYAERYLKKARTAESHQNPNYSKAYALLALKYLENDDKEIQEAQLFLKPKIKDYPLNHLPTPFRLKANCLDYNHEQELYAVADDTYFRIILFKENDTLILSGHQSPVNALKFNTDGNLLASCSDRGTIKFWNPINGQLIAEFNKHKERLNTLAFSPDGRYMVSGGDDNKIMLWEINKLLSVQYLKTIHSGNKDVSQVIISPDNKLLAAASEDDTIRIWDFPEPNKVRYLTGNKAIVNTLDFDAQSKHLISGSQDQSLRLWEINTSTLLAEAYHSSAVTHVKFNPQKNQIASVAADQVIHLWKVVANEFNSSPENASGSSIQNSIFNHESEGSLQEVNDQYRLALQSRLKAHVGRVDHLDYIRNGQSLISMSREERALKRWKLDQEEYFSISLQTAKREEQIEELLEAALRHYYLRIKDDKILPRTDTVKELFEKADSLRLAARNEEAIYYYKNIILEHQSFPNALNALVDCYYATGNLDSASIYLQELFTTYPWTKNTDNLMRLVKIQRRTGKNMQAFLTYDELLRREPQNPQWLNSKGVMHFKMENYDSATYYFRQAIAKSVNYKWAWRNLGLTAQAKENYRQAVRFFQKALAIDAEFMEVWNDLGYTYLQLNNYIKAEECLKNALSIQSKYVLALGNLGDLFYQQKKTEKAIEYYKKALQSDSGYVLAWKSLGDIYSKEKEFEKARESYRQAEEWQEKNKK